MCDKKNSVLFTKTECLVLSPDFKLLDESQVLPKVPKQNNMYSFDLKNVVPSRRLTCLFAKATIDDSNLWHRRLGHINFKTMNKLVRGNLVRGLPSKLFENDHTCVAFQKRKQHKASLTKPHNKTPYELLHGRPPSISFMRPFGCPVTILNTLDPLGKFDRKANKGFLIGYSINSKAFRVINTRTRKVEENQHITFLENKPNVAGSGPDWLFDIDLLTNSMNYEPDTEGNQINGIPSIKDNVDAVPAQQYILLPLPSDSPQSSEDAVVDDAGKKTTKESANESERNGQENEGGASNKEGDQNVQDLRAGLDKLLVQQKEGYANSTNRVSTVSPSVSAVGGAYYDEDVGAKADLNNLETTMNVSPIPITKIHPRWIESMQDELLQFRLQKVWRLVDLSKGKHAIETKWVYRNKKDERGIEVRNKARLVAQGYTQEEGINYDEVFSPVARIEAIRLFLAYASFMGFIVYQDVKSAILYGTTKEEVYVCQPPSFEDPQFPDKVYKVEKALYGLQQAPRAWYETLSTYLLENRFRRGTIDKTLFIKKDKGDILLVQVKQKDDGIFISQDKYVADILKKFDFVTVKIASTPIETNKALLKDEEAKDVDVHLYKSMIGSLMYLTASRPDIMFDVCACARFQVTPKDSPFDLEAFSDSDYARVSLDRKSTTGDGISDEFGVKTDSCKVNAARQDLVLLGEMEGEGSGQPSEPQPTPSPASSSHVVTIVASHPQKTHTPRRAKRGRDTKISQSSGPPKKVGDEVVYTREDDRVVRAVTTATSLEAEQESGDIHKTRSTTTLNEPSPQGTGLGSGPRCQDSTLGYADAQTRFETASKQSCDPPLLEINTSGSGEDSMEHQDDLTDFVPPTPYDSPLSGGHTPRSDEDCSRFGDQKLKRKFKRLEKKLRARTPGMKLFKIGTSKRKSLDKENVSKQGRNLKTMLMFEEGDFDDDFDDIDYMVNEAIENVEGETINVGGAVNTPTTGVNAASASVTTAGVSISTDEPRTPPTTTKTAFKDEDLTIAQTLVNMRNVQARIDADALLAARLQEEEREQFSINEQARFLVDKIAERKSGKKDNDSQKQAESSKKRPRAEHDEESIKKQKLEDDAEKEELRACLDIVPEDDIAINVESLATKYPITRCGRSIQEDEMWKGQQDYKLISWMLFDSCGVHVLLMDTGIAIHMMFEKKYPLTQEMLSRMLNRRLEVDHESTMAFELIRFIKA
ncbi:putative ribonuclease H-like domain-containing protein [Tanacetum coccineum]